MKIDVILNEYSSPADVARLGCLAESYGIHTVWTENYATTRDPFLSLAPLATQSSRIRVAPMAVSPIEMHPVKIANALWTLNEMSGGRASILVGAGGGVMQVIDPAAKRRVRRVRECVEIMKAISPDPENRVNYTGELYNAWGWYYPWLNEPAPQIYVGANGPMMLRMAADIADGLMMSDIPPALLPGLLETVDERLAVRGIARPEFRINNFWAWHIGADAAASYREARRELFLRGYLQPMWLEPFLDAADVALVGEKFMNFCMAFRNRTHVIEGVPDRIIDTLIENLSFTGGLDAIGDAVRRLHEFEALGLTEIALRLHDNQEEAIRIIGEEIVPACAPQAGSPI